MADCTKKHRDNSENIRVQMEKRLGNIIVVRPDGYITPGNTKKLDKSPGLYIYTVRDMEYATDVTARLSAFCMEKRIQRIADIKSRTVYQYLMQRPFGVNLNEELRFINKVLDTNYSLSELLKNPDYQPSKRISESGVSKQDSGSSGKQSRPSVEFEFDTDEGLPFGGAL